MKAKKTKKYLEVKVWKKGKEWFWKVTRQSHRGKEFGRRGRNSFCSSTVVSEFTLKSSTLPESLPNGRLYFGKRYGAFVRGTNSPFDHKICTVPNKINYPYWKEEEYTELGSKIWINRLLAAVAEYNKVFSGGE